MIATLVPAAPTLVGADAAFFIVFGLFVIAFAVLSVITMTWAIRRDRVGRAAWERRRGGVGGESGDVDAAGTDPTAGRPKLNGHPPAAESSGGVET